MVKAVQAGQFWRNDTSGGNFLVTKVSNELFTQNAILRPADRSASDEETIRIKISRREQSATMPGYSFTQDEF
jgi:hypothetical protein